MAVKDYLTDDNGDLAFYNGDLAVGFSDQQHQEDIIVEEIGERKEVPLLGAGATKYLNGPNIQGLKKYVKLNLEADDYKVKGINTPTSIIIDLKEIKPDAERI